MFLFCPDNTSGYFFIYIPDLLIIPIARLFVIFQNVAEHRGYYTDFETPALKASERRPVERETETVQFTAYTDIGCRQIHSFEIEAALQRKIPVGESVPLKPSVCI